MDLSSLTVQQLRYLAAVEHHRSFRDAARACHVTQPALSTQVKRVEEILGLPLFDRTRHPVVPTERGVELVGQARVVLQEIDRIGAIAARAEQPSGPYRLGMIPSLVTTLVPRLGPRFAQALPGVELRIHECKTDELVRCLREGDLDIGIAAGPLDIPGINERVVCHEEFFVYLSPGHPLADREMIHQADLVGEHIWLLSEGHCFRNQVLHLCSVDRRPSAGKECRIEFDSDSFEVLIGLVDARLGVTVLPELIVGSLTEERRAAQVRPFAPPAPVREISLLVAREGVHHAAGQAVLRLLRDAIPAELNGPRSRPSAVLSPTA